MKTSDKTVCGRTIAAVLLGAAASYEPCSLLWWSSTTLCNASVRAAGVDDETTAGLRH